MREKKTENYFKDEIEKKGGLCLKLVLFIGAGFPDRTVLMPKGKIFFVEFKTEYGKLSKLQLHWYQILNKLGFDYYVCRSNIEADIILRKNDL